MEKLEIKSRVTHPWQQQQGETDKAYDWYKAFRDTPPQERNVLALYRSRTGRPEAKAPPGYVQAWVKGNQWYARNEAYDQYLEQIQEEARRDQVIKQAEIWAERRRQLADDAWEAGQALVERAKKILEFPVSEEIRTTETQEQEDGSKVVNVTILKPLRHTTRDAAIYLNQGDRLKRLAANMATDVVTVNKAADEREARVEEAKVMLEKSRQEFPGVNDQIRRERIAQAFNILIDELPVLPETDEAEQQGETGKDWF